MSTKTRRDVVWERKRKEFFERKRNDQKRREHSTAGLGREKTPWQTTRPEYEENDSVAQLTKRTESTENRVSKLPPGRTSHFSLGWRHEDSNVPIETSRPISGSTVQVAREVVTPRSIGDGVGSDKTRGKQFSGVRISKPPGGHSSIRFG